MEYLGLISIAMVLCFCGYPSKVKKLEHEVAKLKSKLNGGNEMSKLINSLVGTKCIITSSETFETFDNELTGTVLETDDDWVKLECIDKKEVKTIRLIRISDITNIKIIDL